MSPKITTAHEQGQRGRILGAATRCFAERGFHEATIQDICDLAGLSKGGLYTYFKSKEEILSALIRESFAAGLGRAQEAARSGHGAIDKLQRIAEAVVGGAGPQSPQLLLEIWAIASKNPSLVALYADGYDQWREFLAGLLREGIAEGVFKADVDPEAVVMVVLAVFGGVTLQEGLTGRSVDWRRVLEALGRGLTEGIVTEETTARVAGDSTGRVAGDSTGRVTSDATGRIRGEIAGT
ncbi:MAG TPA: TetR/AcrR family transcriptional regulator [bacterium]